MKFFMFIAWFTFSSALFSQESIDVTVGMYPFAPFVEQKVPGSVTGMTVDLITALNRSQKKYSFHSILIPPKRRYLSYESGDYDLIFYENINWGWQNYDIEVSNVYQKGGEVYVALKEVGRGQEYFEDFTSKRMLGILGFHYGFANFNADSEILSKKFNVSFAINNDINLTKLLKYRGDIALVTKAYLQSYLKTHPHIEDDLLIADKLDQEYHHTALLRPGSKISIRDINNMLDDLKSSGEMKRLFDKYGVENH